MDKKKWFERRWAKLGNSSLTEALKVAAPQYTDPDVFFKELVLDEENESIADKRLTVLEDILNKDKTSKMEVELERVRIERDRLLVISDFSQLADVPLTNDEKKLYRQYRKYLRELPVLIERGQVIEYIAMTFNEWEVKPPIFKDWNK